METPQGTASIWTVSVRPVDSQDVLAWWRSDSLPDVLAIKAYFAPQDVRVVQYRFVPHGA
jgi:hypothetical protein